MRQRIDPSWKGAFATEVELSAEGLRVRREREELHRMLDEQVAALNRELAQSGIAFKDVDELVNTALPYPAAIPILLKHMTMPYHENIGEMIARALAVPEARYAWDFIVDEYKRAPDLRPDGIKSYRKDALALAVAGAMPPDRWDEFLEIIRDKSNGRSRSLMLEKFVLNVIKFVFFMVPLSKPLE